MNLRSRLDTLRPLGWLTVPLNLALYVALPCSVSAVAQNQIGLGSGVNSAAISISAGQPVILNGIVLNATTNQPVARALVQMGSHSILTEHDGKFQFTDISGSSALLRVTKPGYYDGPDNNSPGKYITFGTTSDTLKLYLYPEALITGTVTGPNGDPTPGIHVEALRKAGEDFGSPWMIAAQASSNSDGQFRLPVSAGDYVIETNYLADRPVRQQAVLPAMLPDPSSGTQIGSQFGAQSTLHLESGTEQQLDLRPPLRPTHEVHIQIDGAQNGAFPQIEAHLPNGLSFYAAAHQTAIPGEFIATLPTGTYMLTMYAGERDGGSYGQTTVTVADSDLTGIVLHMTRLLPTPVEVSVDASSASTSDNAPPPVQQLGLHFIRSDQTAPQTNNPNVYLRSSRGELASFTMPPGRYRLQAQESYQWFVESATIGGTDLLTQDLDVDAGVAPVPLRITVSNQTATLKGTVKLDGNPAANCWVYLIPATRGLTPVTTSVTGTDGSFSRPSLPPGDYRAIAFEVHNPTSVNDPATLQRLSTYVKTFTVAAGGSASLDIDAVPIAELMH